MDVLPVHTVVRCMCPLSSTVVPSSSARTGSWHPSTSTLGSELWSIATVNPVDALAAVADGVLYVAATGGPVMALEPDTGATLWALPLAGEPFAPIVADGYLLIGTSLGVLYAIAGRG